MGRIRMMGNTDKRTSTQPLKPTRRQVEHSTARRESALLAGDFDGRPVYK